MQPQEGGALSKAAQKEGAGQGRTRSVSFSKVLETSLTQVLLGGMRFRLPKFGGFPAVFLLLTSSSVPLWSEASQYGFCSLKLVRVFSGLERGPPW